MWTLKIISTAAEKSLEDWGIRQDFELRSANKQRRTLTITVPSLMDAAPLFTYTQNPTPNDRVILYRDRTAVGTGGTIEFQGWLMAEPQRNCTGGNHSITYVFANVWWLLERHRFKQVFKQFNGYVTPGDPTSGNTFVNVFLPEIFLGEATDGSRWTNGAQITEILNWANECYNPTRRGTGGNDAAQDVLQLGSMDPANNIPISRDTSIHCAEAIIQLLRWCPDVAVQIDEALTPPQINFKSYANQPEITVNVADEQCENISLAPQNDLNVPGIIIYQRRTDDFDGQVFPQTSTDKYPADISEYTPGIEEHFIELIGASQQTVSQQVVATSIADAVSGTAANRLAFWKGPGGNAVHDNSLNDDLIDASTIQVAVASVKDDFGNSINLAVYPRETDSQLYTWMGVNLTVANITADVSYVRYSDASKKIHSKTITKKTVHCRRHLTNAVTGTYSAIASSDVGEAFLTGIAQSIYESRQVPQYRGTIRLKRDQVRSDITIGSRITLVTPGRTFSRLPLQEIVTRPALGEMTLSFSPVDPLSAEARMEMQRATRWRKIYRMPSGRSTGLVPGGTNDLSGQPPKENTHHGEADVSVQTFSKNVGTDQNPSIIFDSAGAGGLAGAPGATAGKPSVAVVIRRDDGSVDTTKPQVYSHHADAESPSEAPVAATADEVPVFKIYKIKGCRDISGASTTGYWLLREVSQFYKDTY